MKKRILIFIILLFFVISVFVLYMYKNTPYQKIDSTTIKKIDMKNWFKLNDQVFPELSDKSYRTVKLGESVYVSQTTKIKFLDVISDNRCPAEVNCVTRGAVKVRLQLVDDIASFNKAYISEIEIQGLNRGPNNHLKDEYITQQNEMPYMDLLVKVLDVSPYPKHNQKITKSDYQVLLQIDKSNIN